MSKAVRRILLVALCAFVSSGFASGPLAGQIVPLQVLVPDLRINGDRPDVLLTAVADLEVGPDGRIYVLQPDQDVIRVFDSQGRLSQTIGRAGDGPGEFRWPMRLGFKTDTLWAWDTNQARISLFNSTGKFVRSMAVGTFGSVRLLTDGTIVIKRYDEDAVSRANGSGLSAPILRYSTDGKILDTIADMDVVRLAPLRIALGGSMAQGIQPFDDAPLWAASGASIMVVERRTAAQPGRAYFRVTKLRPAGDTSFSNKYPYAALPVTPEVVEAVVSEWVDKLNSGQSRDQGKSRANPDAIRSAIHRPPTLPAVSAAALGRDETIWLRREEDGTKPTAYWTVLDGRGAIVANVAGPKELQILRASRSIVWGVSKDSDGVVSVVRYVVK